MININILIELIFLIRSLLRKKAKSVQKQARGNFFFHIFSLTSSKQHENQH